MNDIIDILNKIKFVPEHMQDEVFRNIKKCIENEVNKSCNPMKLLVKRLKELEFGETDSIETQKIISIVIHTAPSDWFWMKPIYCESTKRKSKSCGFEYYVNNEFKRFVNKEMKHLDFEDKYGFVATIAQQAKIHKIDVIEDSYWIYKDGANAEIWLRTTTQFAKEMIYWFEWCIDDNAEEDNEWAYRILNSLEKNFPKKE